MNRAILAGSVIVGIVAMMFTYAIPAFALTEIDNCGDPIDTNGETYILTQNLSNQPKS